MTHQPGTRLGPTDFSPGEDTSSARRPFAGFDPDAPLESFAIAPDGMRLVYSTIVQIDSLMLADGLPLDGQ